jgi:ribonucleotide monophosphatase NagD (HAD superfamily)
MLIIGDDLALECRMARAAGALGALVTTGTHSSADAAAAPPEQRPDFVLDSLTNLVELFFTAPRNTVARLG